MPAARTAESGARLPWRRYLETLAASAGPKALAALGLAIALGLFEGAGLVLLVPLMRIAGLEVGEGGLGQIAEWVSAAFGAIGLAPSLGAVLCLFVFVTAAQSALGLLQSELTISLVNDFAVHLRKRLYVAVTRADWLFISRRRASDFVHTLTSEVDRASTATSTLVQIAANAAILAIYVALAVRISLAMTAVVLAGGGVMLLLSRRRVGASRVKGEELSTAFGDLYNAIVEHVGAVKLVKSYGAHDRNVARFAALSDRVGALNAATTRDQATVGFWFSVGSVALLGAILYVALGPLGLPVASVFLLLLVFHRLTPRISAIQRLVQQFLHLLPAFAAVVEMQAACDAAAEPAPERHEEIELEREIRLEHVWFDYGSGSGPVLRDVSLAIEAGHTTAIVGPSGAGKSTIADMLLGLVAPERGEVLVDGRPLDPTVLGSWRRRIGYVPQETVLFHDTLRANLVWAAPEASDDDLWEALELAAAERFVAELPEKLETVLGDRGVRLSGGERQRLALARALLRRPALLVLDEATSSLDSENERRVQEAIERLDGKTTIVVITHRLSTIRNAETIYVLQEGEVVERGGWAELTTARGRFQALRDAQNL
jgi:ATP-binding cassette subfamily C protein